jgi:hypothetical protein
MRLLLLIVGLGVALEAQTVTVRHYSPYSRSGLGMNVALTGQSASDILTVTLNGTEVFRKTGNVGVSETVRFSYGGRAPGNYTMITSLLSSAGTLKASATETLPLRATGSVVIDQYDNVSVNGKPKFPLTLWLDTLDRFNAWYGLGALTGYGWGDICIGGNCQGPYSASEWQSTLATYLYPNSPYGVIGPNGNELAPYRSSGTVADYASDKAASDMMLYWYWSDEPDINLPKGDGTCPLYDPATQTPVDGCSYLRYLYNETHNNDLNQRPVITDFYGYFLSYSIGGKGYANSWPVAVADIHGYDNYLYLQWQAQSPTLCTDVTGDVSHCAMTVAQYVSFFEYFKSLFYGLTPMHPIIEGGGNGDGTTAYCYSGHSCPGPTGNQFRMESYLLVIHGAKGLTYWTSWAGGAGAPIRSDVVNEMVGLKSNMAAGMEAAILSTPSQRAITSNQTKPGSRVDATIGETGGKLWVIAQRLTDDIANPAEAGAAPLSTQLTVSGLTGTAVVSVMNESRTVLMVNGVITDTFAPYATHIYTVQLPPPTPVSVNTKVAGKTQNGAGRSVTKSLPPHPGPTSS